MFQVLRVNILPLKSIIMLRPGTVIPIIGRLFGDLEYKTMWNRLGHRAKLLCALNIKIKTVCALQINLTIGPILRSFPSF